MGRITTEQTHALLAVLATNTKWEEIDFDASGLDEAILGDPVGAGERFTDFLKKGGKFFEEPRSFSTVPFDIADFPGKEWSVWKGPADGDGLRGKEDIDRRSLKLTEIRVDSLLLETGLEGRELHISGEQKMLRFLKKQRQVIRLGGNVFTGLWFDYSNKKKSSVLEHLYRKHGIDYIDFFGLVLRNPHGHRHVLNFKRDSCGWCRRSNWLDHDWRGRRVSAVICVGS